MKKCTCFTRLNFLRKSIIDYCDHEKVTNNFWETNMPTKFAIYHVHVVNDLKETVTVHYQGVLQHSKNRPKTSLL